MLIVVYITFAKSFTNYRFVVYTKLIMFIMIYIAFVKSFFRYFLIKIFLFIHYHLSKKAYIVFKLKISIEF